MRFSLPPLLGFCLVDDRAIVLDARADRYWMLAPAPSAALARTARGERRDGDAEILRILVDQGLAQMGDEGGALAPCAVHPVEESQLDLAPVAPGFRTPLAASGYAAARARLRFRGLEASLRHLASMRRRHGTANPDRTIAAFARLRLWVSPDGRCLPLSLALATRCATEDIRLVFGVRLNPFAAHAWVQRGNRVLNDEVHVVRQFTPILVQ
jgi:hypothetical protein